jgi:hypothetical protein
MDSHRASVRAGLVQHEVDAVVEFNIGREQILAKWWEFAGSGGDRALAGQTKRTPVSGTPSVCPYTTGALFVRMATVSEPNSSRLTSLKSLGCTTNSYSSINPSSANASGSFTPPTSSPLPDSAELLNGRP